MSTQASPKVPKEAEEHVKVALLSKTTSVTGFTHSKETYSWVIAHIYMNYVLLNKMPEPNLDIEAHPIFPTYIYHSNVTNCQGLWENIKNCLRTQ